MFTKLNMKTKYVCMVLLVFEVGGGGGKEKEAQKYKSNVPKCTNM